MSIGTAAIYSVLGIAVVFCALAMLMAIIIILYNATNKKTAEEKENQGSEGTSETVSTPEKENAEKMSLVSTSEKEES